MRRPGRNARFDEALPRAYGAAHARATLGQAFFGELFMARRIADRTLDLAKNNAWAMFVNAYIATLGRRAWG
jgi:hypothetical protein